jgi:hypothetical protein
MFFKALLNTLLLALVLGANPAFALVKTALTRHRAKVNAPDIIAYDQARTRHFATGSSVNQPLTNNAVHYTADVGVGSPPNICTL